jgi:hypothetical protein
MAALTGIDGSVTIPVVAGGQTGLIYRWSADVDREIIDITSFDDSGSARVKRGGMYQLTGSCEAWFDSAQLPELGTTPGGPAGATEGLNVADITPTGSFVLATKTGDTYTFVGLMTSIRVALEKVGQCVVTMNFKSDGDVTVAA